VVSIQVGNEESRLWEGASQLKQEQGGTPSNKFCDQDGGVTLTYDGKGVILKI
jgi:hypothetical protein